MLDIISMAVLIIAVLLFGIFVMLIIIGGNMNTSDYERYMDDLEQMKFLEEYNKKKSSK